MHRICTALSLLALLSSPLSTTASAQEAEPPADAPVADAPAGETAAPGESPTNDEAATDAEAAATTDADAAATTEADAAGSTEAEADEATDEVAATDETPSAGPSAAAAPAAAFGDGEPLPEPEIEEDEAEPEDSAVSTVVWATAGIAAGSVVVGTVFGFLALSEQASFEDAPTDQKADRGETYALLADVFLFTALASGVTALVLHYGRGSDDDDDEAEVAVDITPVVGRRAGGLSARMRF